MQIIHAQLLHVQRNYCTGNLTPIILSFKTRSMALYSQNRTVDLKDHPLEAQHLTLLVGIGVNGILM